ncbi:MAG: GNAT family N-acetyltransferase, partial [Alphaproteobacteria bacterium]
MLDRIYNLKNLQSEMQSGHFFFSAMLDTHAVGYDSAYQGNGVLWLKKLYVLPEVQGQGIGKSLLSAVVKAFPSCQEIRLLVNRDNLSAQRFYAQQHFIQTDELPVQMGDYKF